jgi:hypothetical protein
VNTIIGWWKNHGTKLIGFASGTISALAGVAGIIPESHLKYYMAAIALMTFWRGFTNTDAASKLPTP